MIKKLSKYGNSQAIIIDKPILEILGINEKTTLEISTDGTSLIITPVKTRKKNSKIKNSKIKKSIEENIEEYKPLLKKLAKS